MIRSIKEQRRDRYERLQAEMRAGECVIMRMMCLNRPRAESPSRGGGYGQGDPVPGGDEGTTLSDRSSNFPFKGSFPDPFSKDQLMEGDMYIRIVPIYDIFLN